MKSKTIIVTLFLGSFLPINAQIWVYGEVDKISSEVNAQNSEESIPMLTADQSTLFFVRSEVDEKTKTLTSQDIYQSNRNASKKFQPASSLSSLNNKFNNAILGMNANGTTVYLLDAYSKVLNPGISTSQFSNGAWSKPKRLEIPKLETTSTLFGFHVNKSEDVIILSFAGNTSSIGHEDLYVIEKKNGNWSAPLHLGNIINSKGFEISPFLSSNADTLFFSSDGFGGMGDADIFYSVKGTNWTSWSAPKNLGAPVNSKGFDAYFSIQGKEVFWSSNRNEKMSDIYTCKVEEPKTISATLSSKNASSISANDGTIDVNIAGGVAPYAVEWNDGNSDKNRKGMKPGTYSATVTDAWGKKSEISGSVGYEDLVVAKRESLEFKQQYDYNQLAQTQNDADLQAFIAKVKAIPNLESYSLKIESSASKVPTTTFKTNELLTQKRAAAMKAMLEKELGNKVKIDVVNCSVNGPIYQKDAQDFQKYTPFQFVKIVLN
jgi:hypothetical protein